jgi:hypothetical protein
MARMIAEVYDALKSARRRREGACGGIALPGTDDVLAEICQRLGVLERSAPTR